MPAVPRYPAELGFEDVAAGTLAAAPAAAMYVVMSYADLRRAMTAVVDSAQGYLAVTGSRSREAAYLERIESVLTERRQLVHYRVLFGPPRHPLLRTHLLRLVELAATDQGSCRLHLGLVPDLLSQPERFIVANERRAVIALPSPIEVDHFDSGLVVDDPVLARGWVQHVRHAYMGAQRIETEAAVEACEVVR